MDEPKKKKTLNEIRIPLAELRMQIVEMMRQGLTEVSLEDYLHMLHSLYHSTKEKD
jgi:hypothetical protein